MAFLETMFLLRSTRGLATYPAMTGQPQMMTLRVTRADRIAGGIHLFELRDATGRELPPFTAGAHIAIRTPSGLLRKYSLCNDPAERNRYQVAI